MAMIVLGGKWQKSRLSRTAGCVLRGRDNMILQLPVTERRNMANLDYVRRMWVQLRDRWRKAWRAANRKTEGEIWFEQNLITQATRLWTFSPIKPTYVVIVSCRPLAIKNPFNFKHHISPNNQHEQINNHKNNLQVKHYAGATQWI